MFAVLLIKKAIINRDARCFVVSILICFYIHMPLKRIFEELLLIITYKMNCVIRVKCVCKAVLVDILNDNRLKHARLVCIKAVYFRCATINGGSHLFKTLIAEMSQSLNFFMR